MNRFAALVGVVTAAAPLGVVSVQADDAFAKDVQITGMYSSMCMDERVGDLVGSEIFVIFDVGYPDYQYHIVYQEAVGHAYAPILLQARLNGNVLEFEVPDDGNQEMFGKYAATITEAGMEIVFEDAEHGESAWKLFKPRRQGYWQAERECNFQ